MRVIEFFVPGAAKPQGSMKWISRGGKSVPITNKSLEQWRSDVKRYAEKAMKGEMIVDGCTLQLEFSFTRPKSHHRTGKYSHLLRGDAPDRMTKKPDIDKLVRSVLDAMTGVVFMDDCEVDRCGVVKRWGGLPGVKVRARGITRVLDGVAESRHKGGGKGKK